MTHNNNHPHRLGWLPCATMTAPTTTVLCCFLIATINVIFGAEAAPVNKGTSITADVFLKEDEFIQVSNVAVMLQVDGNFVIYEDGKAQWASGSHAGTPGQRQTY
eukprot:PhM_4_TR16240/c0_g1_i1/m.7969